MFFQEISGVGISVSWVQKAVPHPRKRTHQDNVNLELKKDGETQLVQCKQWRATKVGVTTVRSLFRSADASINHAFLSLNTFLLRWPFSKKVEEDSK